MGIDSRIDITIEVPLHTAEAKSLPNTLIGLAGGTALSGSSIEITYPIFDGRNRALHGAILKIAREYGLVEEDDDDCVGRVVLFGRWGKVTDAQRGGSLLRQLQDAFLHGDGLPDLFHQVQHLCRTPTNIMKVTYHWC